MATQAEEKIRLTGSWELFSNGLELLRQHLDKVIILYLLPLLVMELGSLLLQGKNMSGLGIYIVGLLWIGLNAPALYLMTTRISLGKSITVGQAYRQGLPMFWRVAGYSIIVGLLVVGGFLLLIVPGLIALRRYTLGLYYLVDKNSSVGEALRASAALSKPAAGYIWGTIGVQMVLSFAIGFVSGLLIGAPALGAIIVCLFALSMVFLLPLRYADVITHVPLPARQN